MKYFIIVLLGFCLGLAEMKQPLQEFISANNAFSISLYKETLKTNDSNNFLMSPYSAETVLAFAYSGSKEETAEELRNTLHLSDDIEKIESGVKESISVLKGDDSYTLHTTNKMYVKKNFPINESFKKVATQVYNADIENIDFVPQIPAAQTMNHWVESQTNNKIKNLISPNILDGHTVTVLINAIYFKGNWTTRFTNSSTKIKDFYKTKSNIVKVDTMHHYTKRFNYHENSELKAKFLELPFEGGDVSMVIVLPDEKEGLRDLENQIDKVLKPQDFRREFVNVALPKFKIETTIDLVQMLKNLGIKKAFTENEADFTGIAGKKGEVSISDVLQKTYIDVEEDGVEAAAATYVAFSFKTTSIVAPRPRSEPKEFLADHPFLFYIKARDFIIFLGKVSDPKQ